jgi:flagellar biosynthesis protein FliP
VAAVTSWVAAEVEHRSRYELPLTTGATVLRNLIRPVTTFGIILALTGHGVVSVLLAVVATFAGEVVLLELFRPAVGTADVGEGRVINSL